MLTAEKMAEWCGGAWKGGVPASINGFCIDTRLIQQGEIFIALTGDDRDGHDYLEAAFTGGAVAAIIVESSSGKLPAYFAFEKFPCLLVKDPAEALVKIATNYRKQIAPKIIAVTGSVGKSTVKELIAQMLATTFKTAKTKGNWNNNIGLPLSIMAMEADTEVAVFELGMNHPGEIEPLCRIAEQTCSVVTNVGPVHLEFFDSVKEIALEKSAALRKLPSNGIAFLYRESEYFELLNDAASCEVRTVSLHNDADYFCVQRNLAEGTAVIREKRSGNEIVLPMPLPGDFNLLNVLFAVGVARWMGICWDSIISALNSYQAMPMRWNKVTVNNLFFVNDAYNANPISMRAAIETFYNENRSKNRWLILGGMLELGNAEHDEHIALGEFIASMQWDGFIAVGELGGLIADGAESLGMSNSVIWRCNDSVEAVVLVQKHIIPESRVLLKGSRGFKLEQVVDVLLLDKK